MADELTTALKDITAILQHLLNERRDLAELKAKVKELLLVQTQASIGRADKVLEDGERRRAEHSERMRKAEEQMIEWREKETQFKKDLLTAIGRQTSAIERHNELIAGLLERGR